MAEGKRLDDIAELHVKSDVKLFELTSQQNTTEKALTAHIRKIT